MDDRWSLLPKLALKNEIAFQVIQCASKSAIFYGMSDALPKLCDMISSLAKVFRYHRVVTPCLECLDFLVDYVPKVGYPATGPRKNQELTFRRSHLYILGLSPLLGCFSSLALSATILAMSSE